MGEEEVTEEEEDDVVELMAVAADGVRRTSVHSNSPRADVANADSISSNADGADADDDTRASSRDDDVKATLRPSVPLFSLSRSSISRS